jgi:2-polyprenyl-6-methoxyphenol hydroxylase-like FAD-dependent oxidoreductase
MAPSGEGANLAMYDGAELGKAIAADPGDAETLRRSRDPLYRPRPVAIRCRRQRIVDLQADIGHVVPQVHPIKHVAFENHARLDQQCLAVS